MKNSTNFNINLDVFPRFAHQKINFLHRDMVEFTRYGYTPGKADALDKQISNFEDFPTDEEYIGDVMIATEKKNALARELLQTIRTMMLHVQNKFGRRSPYYKKFGVSALSQMTNEVLLKTARRVARVSTMHQEELKKEGLSGAHIKELKEKATVFEEWMEVQDDAIADREIGTMQRVSVANELYVEISKICETGKGIWKDVNEAKYNDYIIYNNAKPQKKSATSKEKPEHHLSEASDSQSKQQHTNIRSIQSTGYFV